MQWLTTDDGEYRIESLSAANLPGALKIIREDFFQDEVYCFATEVYQNPLAGEELLELCADAALDGVSLVAVAIASGEVASVIFNKLQEAPSHSSEKTFFEIFSEKRCKQTSARAVVDAMVEFDEELNIYGRYGVDCWLELMFLGTHRQHRGKGLGKMLCKTSEEVAKNLRNGPIALMSVKDLGPKYAFMTPREPIAKIPKLCSALWTGVGSQKIGKALGFTVHVTFPLKDRIFNGKAFSEKGVVSCCQGAAKRIV